MERPREEVPREARCTCNTQGVSNPLRPIKGKNLPAQLKGVKILRDPIVDFITVAPPDKACPDRGYYASGQTGLPHDNPTNTQRQTDAQTHTHTHTPNHPPQKSNQLNKRASRQASKQASQITNKRASKQASSQPTKQTQGPDESEFQETLIGPKILVEKPMNL